MRTYGLIGYPIEHSQSPFFFQELFQKENLTDCSYGLFPIRDISDLSSLLERNAAIEGLNVTSPYKTAIIQYLDEIDIVAAQIASVNVITVRRNQGEVYLKGYNSDYIGFIRSIEEHQLDWPDRVLVLGTGGAAHAVSYACLQHGCKVQLVSRTHQPDAIAYSELTEEMVLQTPWIIQATPLGMPLYKEQKPNFPYHWLTSKHLLYDLVYEPPITAFLYEGMRRGTHTINGLSMLLHQAKESWRIWNLS